MNIETIVVGPLQVNCHVAWEEAGRQALIVDPGDDAERIISRVRELSVTVRGILLTHAHVDHIRGVGKTSRAFDVAVLLHPADHALYASPENELFPWLMAAADLPELGAVPADIPGLSFDTIHTPGHTPGGCCYHFREAGVLISGDTLFQSSIGRTDLPGGSMPQLLESITQRLFVLDDNVRVFAGHGTPTTIGIEKSTNPFVT